MKHHYRGPTGLMLIDSGGRYRNFANPVKLGVQALANERSSRVILYLRVFSGKCDKSALVTSHRGRRVSSWWCGGRGIDAGIRKQRKLIPPPRFSRPLLQRRGRVYTRALLAAVELTAPSSERANGSPTRERERHGLLQFRKVQFLYRRFIAVRRPSVIPIALDSAFA